MNYNFQEADIERRVLDFMHECGIHPQDTLSIVADGKIHRFPVDGDKTSEKAGAYCIYSDGWPAGWVADWRQGIQENWCYKKEHLDTEGKAFFTEEQIKLSKEYLDKHREQLMKNTEERKQKAILDARKLWNNLREDMHFDAHHDYLRVKDIAAYGIRLRCNFNGYFNPEYKCEELVIPVRNIDGEIQTLQFIDQNGCKKFFTDAPVKGGFFSIGLNETFLREYPNAPILLGEGFATMTSIYMLTHMPSVAAMNAGNLYPVAQQLKAKYPDRKIVIMADNDWETAKQGKSNVGLHKARVARDELGLQAVIFPQFADNETGSDWNDYTAIHGQCETAKLLLKQIRYECLPQHLKDLTKKVRAINAQDLRYKEFNPIKWAVEGVIPSGLTVLAGGPKVGKSLLALHLSLAIAIGGCALGKINVQMGQVLYLALEDTERRIQERINGSELPGNCDLSNLDIVTSVPRQDEGGLDYIKLWLSEHPNARLVIVDTLQKFRTQSKGKLNVYAEDYDTLSQLKKVADEYDVAFVVIHHLKKQSGKTDAFAPAMLGGCGDWINQLSGSAGITGCADTILALNRDRVSTHGVLRMTGRDIEEKDFNMKLDGFGWKMEDSPNAVMQLPIWKSRIIDYLNDHETITPAQLSEYGGINIETAKKHLQRGVECFLVKRIDHGVYASFPEDINVRDNLNLK